MLARRAGHPDSTVDALNLIQRAHHHARAGRAVEARRIVDELRGHAHPDVQLGIRLLDALTGVKPLTAVLDLLPRKLDARSLFSCVEDYIEDDPPFAEYATGQPREALQQDLPAGLFMRGRFAEAHERSRVLGARVPDFIPGSTRLRLRSGRMLPRWSGERVRGLVYFLSGGLGDFIFGARYVRAVLPYCNELGVIAETPLIPLFEHAFHGVRFAPRTRVSEIFEAADAYVSSGCIAHLAGAGYGEAHWLRDVPAIDHGPGFHVGLVWAGSGQRALDRLRSCPIDLFAGLLDVPGITWHSLMLGERAKECPAGVIDHSGELHTFMDTARIVAGLDLTITVDSSVSNLCGSMGVPVWVLCEAQGDPRWSNPAWFPSARVFRQDERGTWEPVIERVREALCERKAGPRMRSAVYIKGPT